MAAPEAILLDTHTLVGWAAGSKALSRKVRRLLADEQTRVVVSAATAWEIATKVRVGRLKWASPDSVESYCLGQRFELLPVTCAHGEKAGSWPHARGNPFDRVLAACRS